MTLDLAILDWVVSIREPWSTFVVLAITHTGGVAGTMSIAAIVAVLLARAGRRRDAGLVLAAVLTGWPVMTLLKNLFGRARPPEPERLVVSYTEAFPSGHAMMSAILATVLIVVALRTWPRGTPLRTIVVAGAVAYTFAVGLSRVYLAAHWFTDVVAGWFAGVVWALLWVWLITRVGATRPTRPIA